MAAKNIDTATLEKRSAIDDADDCEVGVNSTTNDEVIAIDKDDDDNE